MRNFCILLLFIFSLQSFANDCDPVFDPPLSNRVSNHEMKVILDHETKTAIVDQELTWINSSTDTIQEIRMHMYLNAFKNLNSTFLKGAGTNIFGRDITKKKEEEWGWIQINDIKDHQGNNLKNELNYIQPDDGNIHDQTVLQVPLSEDLLPGDTIWLDINFTAKLPKTIVRSGYSKDDFFLFVHWFPKPGVYEADANGVWDWNCHPFHRRTEFYSDFGVYDVELTVSDHLVIGASGCRMSEVNNNDGTKTIRYYVEDVIDFAWTAYPHFEVYEDQWEHVGIRLLIPPEHCMLAERYIQAIKYSLEYLTDNVGEYPYPTITIMDPPLHGLRSGMMEYPTFITAGSFYNMPTYIRTMESLAAHEFAHQYFMAMVASNEKEEPWLDEGFVTYFEDRIMDHYYGEKGGLWNIFGYRSGNRELSRLEYTSLRNHKTGIIARPGWEIKENFKPIVYSKTATMLQTLEGLLGRELMTSVIKTYFEKWKFKHPRGTDFINIANEVYQQHGDGSLGSDLNWFFDQCLYTVGVCDYMVADISNDRMIKDLGMMDTENGIEFHRAKIDTQYTSTVTLHRRGELIFPVEIEVTFEDGTSIWEKWDGKQLTKEFEYVQDQRVISANIDPFQKIYLDIDFNNNSKTLDEGKQPLYKYAGKAVFWVQNVLQTVGLLF